MKIALAAIVALAALGGGWLWLDRDPAGADAITFAVARGPLRIGLVESGTIENRENVNVHSKVPGKHTILWLVEEGTLVEEGDLLVQLDSDALERELRDRVAGREAGRSAHLEAEDNLEVVKLEAENEVASAALAHKLALLDLKRFEDEDFPKDLQQARTRITLAQEDLQRANDKLDWSRKLADQGYITRTELQADELAAKRARLELEIAGRNLRTLSDYSQERNLEKLRSQVQQNARALERARHRQGIRIERAEAELRRAAAEAIKREGLVTEAERNLANTRIVAPVSGLVVHATSQRRRRAQPLAEGQVVRERQHLISLPTTDAMVASVKIHESSLQKIRVGMEAEVTVDALPGRRLRGTVSKISLLPDPQMAWLNASLKVYTTRIDLKTDGAELRPGMNCQVEIVVERHDDALHVPLQSVIRAGGRTYVYVKGRGAARPTPVTIGLDNNRVVHILDGVSEGEEVLVAPPLDDPDLASPGG